MFIYKYANLDSIAITSLKKTMSNKLSLYTHISIAHFTTKKFSLKQFMGESHNNQRAGFWSPVKNSHL